MLIRLVLAMLAGGLVTLIYRFTRAADETAPSFTVTLVLLAILIAMVTQVIGDNVARAFSLVGALSIVRFRTVVRDTQDTAYVIFAVAVGMAVGAGHPGLAICGLGVIAFAAARWRNGDRGTFEPGCFTLFGNVQREFGSWNASVSFRRGTISWCSVLPPVSISAAMPAASIPPAAPSGRGFTVEARTSSAGGRFTPPRAPAPQSARPRPRSFASELALAAAR